MRPIYTAALFALALSGLTALVTHAADGQTTIGSGADLFSVAVFDDIAEIETQAGATGSTAGAVDTGDILFKDGGSFDPHDTKSGTTLWVANSAAAFDTVLVTFKDTGAFAGDATVTAVIDDLTNGETLSLVMSLSLAGANQWQGVFAVIDTDTATGNQIFAGNGDAIRVTAPDGTFPALTVDALGPQFDSISPDRDSLFQTSSTVSLGATIRDFDSGMRDDSEGAGDGDTDGLGAEEPIAKIDGASLDIDINLDLANETAAAVAADDESALASSSWSTVTDGFKFSFDRAGHAEGDHFWNIVARDRVGNERRAFFSDPTKNFVVTVDSTAPGAPTNVVKTAPDADPSPTFTWVGAPDANLARHQVKFDGGAFSSVGLTNTFTVGAAAGDLIELDQFVLEDAKFELRIGDNIGRFGYDPFLRIPTIIGVLEIVMGPIVVGETVRFDRLRTSGSKSTVLHCFTVADLGIDECFDPGSGVDDFEVTFMAAGEFIVDDSTDPGAHGVAKFVVTGELMADLSPGTHTIEVRGVDKAGNIGPSTSLVFSVTAPPVPGVTGPALAGLAALLAVTFVWAARRRLRSAAGR